MRGIVKRLRFIASHQVGPQDPIPGGPFSPFPAPLTRAEKRDRRTLRRFSASLALKLHRENYPTRRRRLREGR